MLFVIEHLEPKLSEWLHIEYSHAAWIVGREKLLVTNVKKKNEFHKLARMARIERKRACELFKQRELIVLDPRARRKLSPVDFHGKQAVVVGGILGEEVFTGRTRELLVTSMPRASARNLGKLQFTIDGAAYMAKQASEGKRLEEVPTQFGLEIQINEVYSTFLPYAYPLAKGRPLISRDLVAYLKRH